MAAVKPRTTRELIDTAVAESRNGEFVGYGIAVAVASAGLFVLIWGTVKGSVSSTVIGGGTTALFWPAYSIASGVRRTSAALRLLEHPLQLTTTSEEAARMLTDFFRSAFAFPTESQGSASGPTPNPRRNR